MIYFQIHGLRMPRDTEVVGQIIQTRMTTVTIKPRTPLRIKRNLRPVIHPRTAIILTMMMTTTVLIQILLQMTSIHLVAVDQTAMMVGCFRESTCLFCGVLVFFLCLIMKLIHWLFVCDVTHACMLLILNA